MAEERSTARTVALLASAALILGAVGPWQTTVLVDFSGMQGDGRATLVLAIVAGLIVLAKPPGSRWLVLAALLGFVAALVGGIDLLNVLGSEQELFGRRVQLVSAGWGLWVTVIAAMLLAVATVVLWTDVPDREDDPPKREVGDRGIT